MYYAGHYPYIHVYLLPAFLLGLLILFWRWRTPAGSLLVVWIFGTVLAMTALLSGNNSSRLLVIMPAVMLVCALGIVETLRVLVNGRDWALRPTILAAALAIGAIQTTFYFNVHLERFNKQHYQRQPEQEIAFWARDLPVGTRVHFMDPTWIRGNDLDLMVRTLNPEIVVSIPSPSALRLGYIANIPFRSSDIYFIQDDDFETLAALSDRFVLSAPLKWTNAYSVIGVNYVAYMALADRHGIDR